MITGMSEFFEQFGKKIRKTLEKCSFLKGYRLRNLIWTFILIIVFSGSYVQEAPAFLFEWQTLLTDLLLQERKPSSQIIIVGIDDKSLKNLGAWPWDRNQYAKFMQKVNEENPRVIGFDVIFAEPREGDNLFLEELGKSNSNLVFASKFSGDSEIPPTINLQDIASYGFVNFPSDRDGKVRNAYVMKELDGQCIASFSFEVLSQYFGTVKELDCKTGKLELGFTKIHVDEGLMKINYTGPAGSFKKISFSDVLDGNFEEGTFKDKIVLVGSTAEDISDNLINPFDGNLISGIEIQANVINTVLKKEVIYPIPTSLQIAILACLLILTFFLSSNKVSYSLLSAGGIIVIYTVAALLVFEAGWIIDILLVPFAILSAWITALATKYLKEKQDAQKLKLAFSHYVNPKILHKILADPSALKLGGEKRKMTVLFSDIREFTNISESIPAENLVKLMNKYFNAVSAEILKSNGTIDKFVGDSVMSFWNAPISDKKQAFNACKAAINIIEVVNNFNKKYVIQNRLPKIQSGVGINTGTMIVGNIGCKTRFDYTVLGDKVNIASRLEGLTKIYNVNILLAEGTVQELKQSGKIKEFSIRKLDYVKVKGKEKAVAIYELIGFYDQKKESLIKKYKEAYNLYQRRKFEKAEELFRKIFKNYKDKASLNMAERLKEFAKSPPPRNWDGAWIFYKK